MVRWPPREELYALVWARPAEQVAAALGVSATALAKACARRNIPKPPRGHWARVAAGQTVKRPPLPDSVVPTRRAAPSQPAYTPPLVTQDFSRIPVIARTMKAYRDGPVDSWGRLLRTAGASGPVLDLMVSRDALDRALQVWGLLIQGARTARIEFRAEGAVMLLVVGGKPLCLRLKEEVQAEAGLPVIPPRSTGCGKLLG